MDSRRTGGPAVRAQRRGEYAVSAVRFGADGALIQKARVHRVRPGSVGPPLEILRAQLVTAVEFGTRFVTLGPGAAGVFTAQFDLRLIEVEGVQYLRCDDQTLAADHLPGVVEF